MKETNKIILICDKCLGGGFTYERTSAYDSENVKCDKCNATGKLIKITTIEIKPFEI